MANIPWTETNEPITLVGVVCDLKVNYMRSHNNPQARLGSNLIHVISYIISKNIVVRLDTFEKLHDYLLDYFSIQKGIEIIYNIIIYK